MRSLRILGIRGIPARHGGFETFAEHLAQHLVARGWQVTVYCQVSGRGPLRETLWNGVRLVHCPVSREDAIGTVTFDYRTARHAAGAGELVLTLGYNTACFCALYRLHRVSNIINMDGFEWRRPKWSRAARAWLYLNERLGCVFGDHLVADHPEIESYLRKRVAPAKITMIPYGAEQLHDADEGLIRAMGLARGSYALVIARPEPENSILEMVRAFSQRKRGRRLVVLGGIDPASSPYHRRVVNAASEEVLFPGAIYEREVVNALRFHCLVYLHGHTVGGTNPSLVEALGAGSPVLAMDNAFNRWVAGEGAAFFADEAQCARSLDELLDDSGRLGRMALASRERFGQLFTWDRILGEYERLLEAWASKET